MRGEWIITVLFWAFWSGFVAAGIVYFGANTEPYVNRWPLAGLTGAVPGGAAGFTAIRLWGNGRGVLLMGVPVGILIGVAVLLLWAGK